MTISLSRGGVTLALDPDLLWADEHAWSPVQQSLDVGLYGALIIQADGDAARPGRPITLKPEDDSSAWMDLTVLEQLEAWAAVPLAEFQLTLRGVVRTVMFRHHEPQALEATPVVAFSDKEATDQYRINLKFMEI